LIEISIPGFKLLRLEHLVLDYNGTVAVDGRLIPGVKDRLRVLGENLHIHIITADTFGQVRASVADLMVTLHILPPEDQAEAKRDYVRRLTADNTVCIGNGRNDRLMLAEAALGIAVILSEGAYSGSIATSDVVCTSIVEALDLLTHPLRLTATLRS
jgi:soluble P-type ATPase